MLAAIDGSFPTGPVFKFLSLADGQDPPWRNRVANLLDGKAYLPSPSQFNDPFDCLPPVDLPQTIEDFEARKPAFLERLQASMPDIAADVIADAIDKSIQDSGLEALAEVTRQSFITGGERMGVFCLAECIQSVLMWSHYADNHRGIALRFNFQHDLDGGLMPLFKVRYSGERAVLRAFFGGEEQSEAIVDALCTKADFWQYEQEWRFIEPDGAGNTIQFNPRVITGVILGAKTCDEHAFWLIDLCIKRGIPVMRVVPHTKTFELSFVGVHDPTLGTGVPQPQEV